MGYLYTGIDGTTLREIIEQLGNDYYPTIMVRCLWDYNGAKQDDLIGYCKYENGVLEPLDGDDYSLDDKFIKWEVSMDDEYDRYTTLTVWEKGESMSNLSLTEQERDCIITALMLMQADPDTTSEGQKLCEQILEEI